MSDIIIDTFATDNGPNNCAQEGVLAGVNPAFSRVESAAALIEGNMFCVDLASGIFNANLQYGSFSGCQKVPQSIDATGSSQLAVTLSAPAPGLVITVAINAD